MFELLAIFLTIGTLMLLAGLVVGVLKLAVGLVVLPFKLGWAVLKIGVAIVATLLVLSLLLPLLTAVLAFCRVVVEMPGLPITPRLMFSTLML